MGAYLSSPALEKTSQDFTGNRKYECGLSGMQGWRISMEDAHNCNVDVDEDTSFFAVYDGHGGGEVAIYCSLHFVEMLKQSEAYKAGDMETALSETFMTIDRTLKQPQAIRELKVLSHRNPGDPPPTEEDYKQMDEDEKEDEDETKLLYEEATMNIEDLLARYGRVANETKEAMKNIKEESTKDTLSDVESLNKEEKDTHSGSSSQETDPSEKQDIPKEISENTISQKEVNVSSDNVDTKENTGEHDSEKENLTTKEVKSTKLVKKTFVKVKPTKHVDAEEDSEDDDYDGFESDEAMEGSSSEEEEEEDDEDEDSDDDIEIMEEQEDPSEPNNGGTNISELEAIGGSGIDEPGSDSGTTAVVALVKDNKLYVANAGDSRCVLCRKDGKSFDMSDDHKPEDEKELNRIQAAGGHVNPQGRVNGGLNLSRAIGDHCYKTNKNLSLEEQMISALPDIRTIKLEPGDEFMVLACDGIWNVMSSQEVVDFVRERLAQPLTPVKDEPTENGDKKQQIKLSKICEEIFDKCLAPNTEGDGTGCDNMTCLIVKFDQTWLQETHKSNTDNNNSESIDTIQPVKKDAGDANNGTELSDNKIGKAALHTEVSGIKRLRAEDTCAVVNGDAENNYAKRSKSD